MSTSFPFLKIARDHHRPYGEVIRFVAWLEKVIAIDPGYFTLHPDSLLLSECLDAIEIERTRRLPPKDHGETQ